MDAALLLGGEGRRLKPLTEKTPKPLIPLGGEPLFHHTLRRIYSHVEKVHLLTAGEISIWQRYLGFSPFSEKATLLHEEERLGTGGGVRGLLKEASSPLLVVNGDLVLEGDLLPFLKYSTDVGRRGYVGVLLSLPVSDRSAYGSLLLDGERVVGFVEKGEEGKGWIYGGMAVLLPGAEGYFPGKRRVSLEREVFPAMAEDGALIAFRLRAPFSDAGTLEGLLAAQRIIMSSPLWPFREERYRTPALLRPPVFISPDASIEGGTIVGPYATVMDGVILEEGVRVENSLILNGVRVGRGSSVVNSVISPGVRVGEGGRVEGKIL